ncbi:MAG: enolase C-terminal domain-like protein [Planctomycetaceae bacterium]
MQIRSLEAFEVPIKLRKPIRHASHVRDHNDTLFVRCELQSGHVGWGEGLARTYVTGESIDSVWRHLTATRFDRLADARVSVPSDFVALWDGFSLADVEPDAGIIARECFGQSVRCALELALLDAFCQAVECSVSDFLKSLPEAVGLRATRNDVRYSGVITSVSDRTSQYRAAFKMRLFGFRHVKVKVGTGRPADDERLLWRIRRVCGRRMDLRLDANEAWRCDDVVGRMQLLAPFEITCLEQPVAHADVCGLADVRRELTVPIMLDESLCCREDADRAIRDGTCDLFNLRISKCGGLIPTVRLAALAAQHQLGYQLGCLVGETEILSAAGRHFACSIANIRYLEGSYDRFLVRNGVTRQNLTFGYGGRATALPGHGLGVTVDESLLRSAATRSLRLI